MGRYMKRILIVACIAIVAGAGTWFLFFTGGNGGEQTLVMRAGAFEQHVAVSGKVVAADDFDLSFEQSGTVTAVLAEVGDTVQKGVLLVSQDSTQLNAQLLETRASIEVEKAKLRQFLAGASAEDIQIAETAVHNAVLDVENAKQALRDAEQKMVDTLKDAYTKADDAIRIKTDQLFTNPRGGDPQLSVGTPVGGQLETDVEWQRSLLEKTLSAWSLETGSISITSDLSQEILSAKKNFGDVASFLNAMVLVVNGLTANSNVTQTTIDKWRTDVATARTNVNTAISNLTAADTNVRTEEADVEVQEGALQTAEYELALQKAPARVTDIALYEAQIQKAEASAAYIRTQLAKREIRAPLAGVITQVQAKAGSVLSASEKALSLISLDTLQIESYVPELNISRIEKGDETVVVLDAYGDEMPFAARVVSIDPAETIRDGVSTYRILLQFVVEDQRIKSGMTANIMITTEKKTGVLSVPEGGIITRDGKKYVHVREGETLMVERKITTGSVSSLGNVEILSGLQEGDVVFLGVAE